jgi:hypothetical protein
LFRRWYAIGTRESRPVMWDQGKLDWFLEMNRSLRDPLDDAGVRARLRDGLATLRELAATIRARAATGGLEDCDGPVEASGATPLFAEAA